MATSVATPDIGSWFERYAPSVRHVAVRVPGDLDDADDALQDAFLAAWRSRARFDPARRPLPWLVTIARRKALTIAADRSRKADLLTRAELAPSAGDGGAAGGESNHCLRQPLTRLRGRTSRDGILFAATDLRIGRIARDPAARADLD